MTRNELVEYDLQLEEYFDMLVDKLNSGKMDAVKFARLADKLDEWAEEARR